MTGDQDGLIDEAMQLLQQARLADALPPLRLAFQRCPGDDEAAQWFTLLLAQLAQYDELLALAPQINALGAGRISYAPARETALAKLWQAEDPDQGAGRHRHRYRLARRRLGEPRHQARAVPGDGRLAAGSVSGADFGRLDR